MTSESKRLPRDSGLLGKTLMHLEALVAFDTRNPPRAIGTGGIFDYLHGVLPGFEVQVTDHGAGSVSLFAVRGRPHTLFNVHLDTVPDSRQWTSDPFTLRVTGDRAIGLGACDIKGAAAALLACANATRGDMALLFTTDEEGADPHCVPAFLREFPSPRGCTLPPGDERPVFEAVIVAEPTRCQAVLAHRGIESVRLRFRGRAGHASAAQKPGDSALHQAVRWSNAALDFAEGQSGEEFDTLRGLRLNLGRIEGGIKPNIVAPDAEVRFGMRPLPSTDPDALLQQLRNLIEPAPAAFEETFRGPPLPACRAEEAGARRQAARVLAEKYALPVGSAVDFWTEAALFSEAGYAAIVFGPGNIAEAHAADEWVALEQLERAALIYSRLLEETR